MEEHWRWLLVDSLAHGKTFWRCHMNLSLPDSDGSLMLEVEKAKESGNIERMRAAKDRLQERLDSFVNLKLNASFSHEEQQHIMLTPRFDISQTSYLKTDIDYKDWDAYIQKLPALAVPFSEFWMEWAWNESTRNTRFATRIKTHDTSEGLMLSLETFMDFDSDAVSDKQRVCAAVEGQLYLDLATRKATHIDTKENDLILFIPIIHSLALLNCRNVKTEELAPPRQIRRQVMRTHGVALCSYRIIHITHSGSSRSRTINEGEKRHTLSICRGHFKTFSSGGLFGKLNGTWWWQDHVRGDYEHGVVVNDYKLSGSVGA